MIRLGVDVGGTFTDLVLECLTSAPMEQFCVIA